MAKQAKTDVGRDIQEMMNAWSAIEAKARKQFPNATAEELYHICKGAMLHALGQR